MDYSTLGKGSSRTEGVICHLFSGHIYSEQRRSSVFDLGHDEISQDIDSNARQALCILSRTGTSIASHLL